MEPHSGTINRKIGDDDDDLAEYVRQAGAGSGVADVVRMIGDGDYLVLLDQDDLRTSLENATRDGKRQHVQCASMRQVNANVGDTMPGPELEPCLVVIRSKKSVDVPNAKLSRETKMRLEKASPERRKGTLNLGLGVTIFALMSVTSLAILSPPYSYAVAVGALAPAGIMLARAARKNCLISWRFVEIRAPRAVLFQS